MKKFYFLLSILSLPVFSFGQVAQVWAARYSFTMGTDKANSMGIDDSGNVYVTGSSVSGGFGTEDYNTVKYNTNGVFQWAVRYNGSASGMDIARSIAVDSIGNSYVTGSSAGLSGYTDCLTIKYDTNGDTVWTARYNGSGNKNDIAYSIAIDAAGNVYVTGSTEGTVGTHGIFEDYVTIKYNSSGGQMWENVYNGPGGDFDAAYSIAVDNSGNVIVTGESGGGSSSSSDSYQDYATIKYGPTGIPGWVNRYNGPLTTSDEKANRVVVDALGNVYVTGESEGLTSSDDYLTLKYTSGGGLLWTARHNGLGDGNDEAYGLAVDESGNCYVTGEVYNGAISGKDIETIQYNSAGAPMWSMIYNGSASGNDEGKWVEVDALGNVYVTGSTDGVGTSDDYVTIKYNTTGSLIWSTIYSNSGAPGSEDVPSCLKIDNLGDVYVTGMSALDFATVKYSES
ncbi:MAG: hypothetical protein A2W11_13660, partial [Ignavibacteria bacterium RBG_16_35_7]